MEQLEAKTEDDSVADPDFLGGIDLGEGINIKGGALLFGSFLGLVLGLLLLPVYRTWNEEFQWAIFIAFIGTSLIGVFLMIKWEKLDMGWTLFFAGCIGAVALATIVFPFISGTL